MRVERRKLPALYPHFPNHQDLPKTGHFWPQSWHPGSHPLPKITEKVFCDRTNLGTPNGTRVPRKGGYCEHCCLSRLERQKWYELHPRSKCIPKVLENTKLSYTTSSGLCSSIFFDCLSERPVLNTYSFISLGYALMIALMKL